MGFNPDSRAEDSNPDMVLVAMGLPRGAASKVKAMKEASDAFLEGPGAVDKLDVNQVAQRMGKDVWGVRVSGLDAAQARSLIDGGCDFIVLDSLTTEAAVLNEEELGIVVTVGSDLGEQETRAVSELQVDAVLFSPAQRDLPLTVDKLIDIQRVLGAVDAHFLVEAPIGMGAADLEVLRNMGVAGIIADASAPEIVVELRSSIDGLPRRKPRPARGDALVPHHEVGAGDDMADLPDEEDDEDW